MKVENSPIVECPNSIRFMALATLGCHLANKQSWIEWISRNVLDFGEMNGVDFVQAKVTGMGKRLESWKSRCNGITALAEVLLAEDNRGDKAVFSRSWPGGISYGEVTEAYLGDEVSQRERELRICLVLDGVSFKSLDARHSAEEAIKDWTWMDAAITTLILNKGNESTLPDEVRSSARGLGIISESNIWNVWEDPVDQVMQYRNWQNWLFIRALLAVWHRGELPRMERDLPILTKISLTYQLGTDLFHQKNQDEPTFNLLLSEIERKGLSPIWDELGSIWHEVPVGKRLLFQAPAVVAVGMLCLLGKPRAEWETGGKMGGYG